MAMLIPQRDPCPFCGNLDGSNRCTFVIRGDAVSAFVNPRQYERGALLVIPNRHVPSILDATADEMAALAHLSHRLAQALARAFPLTGINLFQNNGISAGQTVPHMHYHLVPRYTTTEQGKIYRERDYQSTPMEEREQIAALVRRELDGIE